MKCTETECQRVATHITQLNIPAKGYAIGTHPPIRMMFAMPFCEDHAKNFDLKGTLAIEEHEGEPGLRQVVEAVTRSLGKAQPDLDRAWVTARKLTDSDVESFMAAKEKKH